MRDRDARDGEGSLLLARERVTSSISISIACSSGWVELNVGVGMTKDIMNKGAKTLDLIILCFNPGFLPAWENRVRIPNLHSFSIRWRTKTFTTQC